MYLYFIFSFIFVSWKLPCAHYPLLLILSLDLIGSWAFWLLSYVPPVIIPQTRTTGLVHLIFILAAVFSWMCFITSPLALSLMTAFSPTLPIRTMSLLRLCLSGGWGDGIGPLVLDYLLL